MEIISEDFAARRKHVGDVLLKLCTWRTLSETRWNRLLEHNEAYIGLILIKNVFFASLAALLAALAVIIFSVFMHGSAPPHPAYLDIFGFTGAVSHYHAMGMRVAAVLVIPLHLIVYFAATPKSQMRLFRGLEEGDLNRVVLRLKILSFCIVLMLVGILCIIYSDWTVYANLSALTGLFPDKTAYPRGFAIASVLYLIPYSIVALFCHVLGAVTCFYSTLGLYGAIFKQR